MRMLPVVVALFIFWLVLSGSRQPTDLLLGLSLSVVIGIWTVRFLWSGRAPRVRMRQLLEIVVYFPTFVKTVVTAALQVAVMALSRRPPVDPVVITHVTPLRKNVSRVAMANALTLTPGTLAVDLDAETLHVHCLAPEFSRHFLSGELEDDIGRVFERDHP